MAYTGERGSGGRGGRRPSPAVYRRRRLAVLILAVLVVAVLAIGGTALAGLLGRGGDATAGASASPGAPVTGAAPSGTATPAPTASAPMVTPSATPTPAAARTPTAAPAEPTASDACDAARVVVAAETDHDSYAPDENPVLTLVVRNEGEAPCTVNVGTSQMEFVITSGGERIFSSTDCQQASQDLERTIAPDGEERATFEWTRNRTVPGCTGVEGEPGSGEYTVTTRLGARSSSPLGFTLQ